MIKKFLDKLKNKPLASEVKLPVNEEQNLLWVKKEAKVIKEARKEAQKDIGYFIDNLTKFVNSPNWIFSIKKHFVNDNQHEHMWIAVKSYKNGIFYGTLNNKPLIIKSMKFGDNLEIPKKEVDDWMFFDPRINSNVGGYSVIKLKELRNNLQKTQK